MMTTAAACTCHRPEKGLTCRCTCSKCGSRKLKWVPWGVYLDKDSCFDCLEDVAKASVAEARDGQVPATPRPKSRPKKKV